MLEQIYEILKDAGAAGVVALLAIILAKMALRYLRLRDTEIAGSIDKLSTAVKNQIGGVQDKLSLMEEIDPQLQKSNIIQRIETNIKGIEKSIQKLSSMQGELMKELEETGDYTKRLWNIHDKYNEDGAPKWYFPASLSRVLQDILNQMQEIYKLLDVLKRG